MLIANKSFAKQVKGHALVMRLQVGGCCGEAQHFIGAHRAQLSDVIADVHEAKQCKWEGLVGHHAHLQVEREHMQIGRWQGVAYRETADTVVFGQMRTVDAHIALIHGERWQCTAFSAKAVEHGLGVKT